jgi:hypothetical protein
MFAGPTSTVPVELLPVSAAHAHLFRESPRR